ncbi:DNA-binding transcriptional regulator, LacI/PurR family [Amycolatopsis arida]|uniref:DNA-binding transcriptional regulator, LacI/PurR family n=1 Tax=Amycolatopsis arida TaxID=587909 RepID=A0A1I5MFE7_9PSEU|nr:LacI family DNA-binding transcriptional regulator [Amycolatopsis arida]TDX94074.1 DNA-binding LacI/PurR family transcriptional regulator [Amycolatopsis arida]SFP08229.1 DNA-binding transcriptional regulator, LacI/PurR family [Amycolatopsis arida]
MSQVDIARRASVTQAAVSLILRGKAASIPKETRQRVLDVARELGYRADPLARRLAKGRSQLLGVFTYERVFSVAQRSFYHPFLLGIEEAAEEAGHDLLLFTSAATSGPMRSIYAGGENKLRLVDGAVLLGRDEIPAELEHLVVEEYPFVFIGRRFLDDGREVPNVSPDYAGAGRTLAGRLAALGHRRIAYVGANPDLPATADRLAGLRAGALDVSPRFPAAGAISPAFVRELRRAGVTAVVAESTGYAEEVRIAAERCATSVPGGLSVAVAGIPEDGEEGARGGWSGYGVPGRLVGRRALERLLARLDGDEGDEGGTVVVECPAHEGGTLAAPENTTVDEGTPHRE